MNDGGTVLAQAKYILIATGAKAHKLPIPGAEHAIISDHVLDLPERPRKMAIIGGGYIAVEFAGIFNNYGSEVHLVYRQASWTVAATPTFQRRLSLSLLIDVGTELQP